MQQGVKLKDLVRKYIEAGLREQSGAVRTISRERRPLPTAIRRDPNITPAPALTNKGLSAILEEDELAKYERVIESLPSDK